MNCPVCEKRLVSMVCGCGYDASRDYEKYPAFGLVPKGMVSASGLRSRMKKQIRLRERKPENCPVCEKKLDSFVCGCGYDVSLDYGKYPAFGPAPKGTVSVLGLRNRAKSLIRCAGCGHHAFSLDHQKGKLCCLQCGRALTAQELKPLMDALEMRKEEQKPVVKPAVSKPKEPVQPEAPKSVLTPVKMPWQNKQENAEQTQSKQIVELSAGNGHIVILYDDGTVKAQGSNDAGQCEVDKWRDIIAIAAGGSHTVGLKEDGTVVAVGDQSYGRCDVSQWKNVMAIGAGLRHTVGLKKDGTVVAVGDNSYGQCKVAGWRNVQAIAVCDKQTVALKRGGTVVATGFNKDGRCDVSGWIKIAAIAAGTNTTVGLRVDGTLVSAGVEKLENLRDLTAIAASDHILGLRKDGTVAVLAGSGDQCNVGDWKDVLSIAAGKGYSLGLKQDGTMVQAGSIHAFDSQNDNGEAENDRPEIKAIAAGQSSFACVRTDGTVRLAGRMSKKPSIAVVGWENPVQQIIHKERDITAVTLGFDYNSCCVAVLKEDGTVVAVKRGPNSENPVLWGAVSSWRDIAAISMGGNHMVGLKKDGTVVIAELGKGKHSNVSSWRDMIAVSAGRYHTVGLRKNGTVEADGDNNYGQCKVSAWQNIAAISAGENHTVGLKKDGTVVAIGKNNDGQCLVSDWKDIVAISAGDSHTVGLKRDGTVVAAGRGSWGQCKVADWQDIAAVSAGSYCTMGLKKDGTLVSVGGFGTAHNVQELMRK